jgi:hypothetical protein
MAAKALGLRIRKENLRKAFYCLFKLYKRSQYLIRARNETLPVIAMCVNNPDCSSRWNARLTETARVHGCFSSQSFWKAGSARKGSQSRSSLRRAGVMGAGL